MSNVYEISIRTGTKSGAGTDAVISVTLLGTEGNSGPHKLDRFLHNDFEAGRTDTYEVKAPDCGELIGLRFHSAPGIGGLSGEWYMDEAEVRRGDRHWSFPNFTWLKSGNELTVQEESAKLPQHCDLAGEFDLRRLQIMQRRERFLWRANDGSLPGALEISEQRPIPVDEKYRDLKEASYQVVFARTMLDMKTTSNLLKKVWTGLDDVMELFAKFEVPRVAERWKDDLEFARQTVQGVSPLHIQAISELPEGMTLTEELVYGLMEPGMLLDSALAGGRLFLVDFEELIGVPLFTQEQKDGTVERRWAPPARALFYLHSDGQLRPLGIQLDRSPDGLVFTPRDSEYDWLAAKMYFRCAEGNVHQLLPHALRTHLVVEPFVIATLRNLAASHPVFKLMRRHLRYTLAINEGARESLLAPGGVFDNFMATGGPDQGHIQLLLRGYVGWRLEHNNPRKDLASRGVLDPAVLPYYPYRDDALPIWDAIVAYVSETLRLHYRSDQDLVDDNEMQDWWADLVAKGHPVEKLPCERLERVEDLIEILAIVIFTATAQHAAVNYLQYEHYAYVPNAPLCMREPPPTEKGRLDEKGLVAMMPSKAQSTWQVAIGRALASFGRDEEYLHNPSGWHEDFFEEPEAIAALERFRAAMAEQDARARRANETRPVPYELLLPSKIPTSITI